MGYVWIVVAILIVICAIWAGYDLISSLYEDNSEEDDELKVESGEEASWRTVKCNPAIDKTQTEIRKPKYRDLRGLGGVIVRQEYYDDDDGLEEESDDLLSPSE